MFTVNEENEKEMIDVKKFQNISCLRLIKMKDVLKHDDLVFQNISCLRLIKLSGKRRKPWLYFKTFHVYG